MGDVRRSSRSSALVRTQCFGHARSKLEWHGARLGRLPRNSMFLLSNLPQMTLALL